MYAAPAAAECTGAESYEVASDEEVSAAARGAATASASSAAAHSRHARIARERRDAPARAAARRLRGVA
jgi:hypothetical protein